MKNKNALEYIKRGSAFCLQAQHMKHFLNTELSQLYITSLFLDLGILRKLNGSSKGVTFYITPVTQEYFVLKRIDQNRKLRNQKEPPETTL